MSVCLLDPHSPDRRFRASGAATSARRWIGPGFPVFLVEELHKHFSGVGRTMEASEVDDDGVLVCLTYDAIYEHTIVALEQREMDTQIAENGGTSRAGNRPRHGMLRGHGRYDGLALMRILAGRSCCHDERIRVDDKKNADRPGDYGPPASSHSGGNPEIVDLETFSRLAPFSIICRYIP